MQENSLIKQNILKYLDNKGITQYKFYKDNNVTRGILTQNNGITEENLLKFVHYAQDISLKWLLTGEGPMLKSGSPPEPSENNPETPTESSIDTPLVAQLRAIIQEQALTIAHLEIELANERASVAANQMSTLSGES